VIVLSHQLWVSRFGKDPGILGRNIVMNGRGVTVVGVTLRVSAAPMSL
jgi:hypothetical protein